MGLRARGSVPRISRIARALPVRHLRQRGEGAAGRRGAKLLALVDHVTGPDFLPEYEALGARNAIGRVRRRAARKRKQAKAGKL
jgi:hypothetical protein